MKALLIAASIATLGLCAPALAAPVLKGEARVSRDVVTLGDLVDGLDAKAAGTALFASPRLGESGTIQASRAIEAARSLGIDDVDPAGLTQTVVIRLARRIGTADIDAALRDAFAKRQKVDPAGLTFTYDGNTPSTVLPPDINGPLVVEDLAIDLRGRRLTANLSTSAAGGTQRRSLRVSAAFAETMPVAVLTRSLARGETAVVGDVAMERRTRESLPPDAITDAVDIVGRIARRTLGPGAPLRATDLAKPDIVARGEIVTLVYEGPGLTLTTRGKASEAAGLGDLVAVQNLQSKRMLQATVTGPGRVSVTAPQPGRLASNDR